MHECRLYFCGFDMRESIGAWIGNTNVGRRPWKADNIMIYSELNDEKIFAGQSIGAPLASGHDRGYVPKI